MAHIASSTVSATYSKKPHIGVTHHNHRIGNRQDRRRINNDVIIVRAKRCDQVAQPTFDQPGGKIARHRKLRAKMIKPPQSIASHRIRNPTGARQNSRDIACNSRICIGVRVMQIRIKHQYPCAKSGENSRQRPGKVAFSLPTYGGCHGNDLCLRDTIGGEVFSLTYDAHQNRQMPDCLTPGICPNHLHVGRGHIGNTRIQADAKSGFRLKIIINGLIKIMPQHRRNHRTKDRGQNRHQPKITACGKLRRGRGRRRTQDFHIAAKRHQITLQRLGLTAQFKHLRPGRLDRAQQSRLPLHPIMARGHAVLPFTALLAQQFKALRRLQHDTFKITVCTLCRTLRRAQKLGTQVVKLAGFALHDRVFRAIALIKRDIFGSQPVKPCGKLADNRIAGHV